MNQSSSRLNNSSTQCAVQLTDSRVEPRSIASDFTTLMPQYQAPSRRAATRAAVLRSPYIDYCVNKSFKGSRAVCTVYDAVCKFGAARKTRAKKNQDVTIINYSDYFVSLNHLAQSVKPGGVLLNTTCEIGLFAIKDIESKHPKVAILPLRVANFLQKGDLTAGEVNIAFKRKGNHLDRSKMVMIPVLQKMDEKASDDSCGHYFLFIINLRDKRFEVLDSMRSIADKKLLNCCIKLIDAVKNLWAIHYPESKNKINDFELLDVDVPKQTNNYDCGFHMLLHAQYWNGRKVYKFSEDIPNARKPLTYSWITHPENDVNWKPLLGLEYAGLKINLQKSYF
ncbi:hypothetical protein ACP4OV_021233 [Aristida adscensionis]